MSQRITLGMNAMDDDRDYLTTVIDAVPIAIKDFMLPQADLVAKTEKEVGK